MAYKRLFLKLLVSLDRLFLLLDLVDRTGLLGADRAEGRAADWEGEVGVIGRREREEGGERFGDEGEGRRVEGEKLADAGILTERLGLSMRPLLCNEAKEIMDEARQL